jgi:hypothetical protein
MENHCISSIAALILNKTKTICLVGIKAKTFASLVSAKKRRKPSFFVFCAKQRNSFSFLNPLLCWNVLSLFFQLDCLQIHLKEAISRDLKLKLHLMKEATSVVKPTEQSSRHNRISQTGRRVNETNVVILVCLLYEMGNRKSSWWL